MAVDCTFWCADHQPDYYAGELKKSFNLEQLFALKGGRDIYPAPFFYLLENRGFSPFTLIKNQ